LIYILGDMFELGEFAHQEHQYVADIALQTFPKLCILAGEEFNKVNAPEAQKFNDTKEAVDFLKQQDIQNSVVLIKASNGMNFQSLFDSKDW
jgi:UDP-N-acetylmuramoyl-tripeptide--D-alanyl-D-alanine ligase